ncbi:hypothetical protein AVEN_61588-1 [Araneus ventricosus]|uniref:Uncharacterized protein n=1 Tax=Araneus ventricosus TaxID=182803 RepID=A0A4Y2NJR2_ARAVE|nr:hypothetical protein AVEN_61588-1 [Araneus ventricosus]
MKVSRSEQNEKLSINRKRCKDEVCTKGIEFKVHFAMEPNKGKAATSSGHFQPQHGASRTLLAQSHLSRNLGQPPLA